MNLKSVATLAFAAVAIASTSPAQASAGATGPTAIESAASQTLQEPDRSYGRFHYRSRHVVLRTPRYRAAPQIRRIRHAVVRLQLRVLAMQIHRLRHARHYHGPRARVIVRGGGYRVLGHRPHIRLVRHNPRVGLRRFRI